MEKKSKEMKAKTIVQSIEWKIEFETEQLVNAKKKIERELENFNEVTSPEWLAQYSKEMLEARNNLRALYERKREVEWLVSEFIEA